MHCYFCNSCSRCACVFDREDRESIIYIYIKLFYFPSFLGTNGNKNTKNPIPILCMIAVIKNV